MKVGIIVKCIVCGRMKKPIGRSAGLDSSFCDDECSGYRQEPLPGSLWPGETEQAFGYPVGTDGTTETDAPVRLRSHSDAVYRAQRH